MRRMHFGIVAIAILTLVTGCRTFTEPFAPPQSFDIDDDIKQLETKYGSDSSVTGFYAEAPSVARRNEFITGRMALINLQYVRFVRAFAADKAQIDTALDMLQLGVDLAITVGGGASVKAALGAASAGITGTRTSIDKTSFSRKPCPF